MLYSSLPGYINRLCDSYYCYNSYTIACRRLLLSLPSYLSSTSSTQPGPYPPSPSLSHNPIQFTNSPTHIGGSGIGNKFSNNGPASSPVIAKKTAKKKPTLFVS